MSNNNKRTFNKTQKRNRGITHVDRVSGKSFSESPNAETRTGSKINDPSWYAGNEQLMKDAASLAFSNVTGLQSNLMDTDVVDPARCRVTPGAETIPGIMSINWCPNFGYSDDGNSAINIAARNIYSNVRYANSGHANYMPNDLMLYIVGVGQAYSWISTLMRLYGVINLYSARNRYLPKALVGAMGFNYDDILLNLPQLRYHINSMIAKTSVLWVPNTMPLFKRWFWMNANVYADDDDQKAQLYVFRQRAYFKYNPTYNDQGGALEYVGINSNMNMSDIINLSNTLIDVLVSDEDIGIMAGDILKAFGSDRIYKISEIPADFTVMPAYEPEVLLQIHNSIAFTFETGNLSQNMDTGILEFKPEMVDTTACPLTPLPQLRKYLDYPLLAPEPSLNMVATRLMPMVKGVKDESGTVTYPIKYAGTELVYNFCIYRFNEGEVLAIPGYSYNINDYSAFLVNSTKFRYHPVLYTYFNIGDVYTLADVFGEIDNYTTVGSSELSKMHETAILSEFGVPYRIN